MPSLRILSAAAILSGALVVSIAVSGFAQETPRLRADANVRAAAHNAPLNAPPTRNLQPSVPLSKPGATNIPLPPPRARSESGSQGGAAAFATMLLSLAAVVGIFLTAAWLLKRSAGAAGVSTLPKEAFQVLGRAPMGNRQQAHLLRIGSKLLLVANGPDGAKTLTEITERDEVNHLLGLCQQKDPLSATNVFRDVLKQFQREKPAPGFIDSRGRGEDEGADV